MGCEDAREVVFVKHVPWEGPHRIEHHLHKLPAVTVDVLEGASLPAAEDVAAAVVMGGPMGVGDMADYPQLADEIRWVAGLLERDVPLLGICLGSQLIAKALGVKVKKGPRAEIGWYPIEVTCGDDPLLKHLAPSTTVLHWHMDVFDLPPGAVHLASSALTECQGFRYGKAWGLLFHPEADGDLVERWLSEHKMATNARAVLGEGYGEELKSGAREHSPALVERSAGAFEAFAGLIEP